jgi:hypothetical protein
MTSFRELSLDRERLSEGTKVVAVDTFGKETDHWFLVRSEYSDEVQQALDMAEIEKARNPHTPISELKLEARISLVMDWSFEEELTTENVREMLRNQPLNADRIDKGAGDLKRFFPERGLNSLNGQKKKSSSKAARTKKTGGQSATT